MAFRDCSGGRRFEWTPDATVPDKAIGDRQARIEQRAAAIRRAA
jgi:hypothetical protein